jgi:hypothetical protein
MVVMFLVMPVITGSVSVNFLLVVVQPKEQPRVAVAQPVVQPVVVPQITQPHLLLVPVVRVLGHGFVVAFVLLLVALSVVRQTEGRGVVKTTLGGD